MLPHFGGLILWEGMYMVINGVDMVIVEQLDIITNI